MQQKGYPTLPLMDLLSKSQEQFNNQEYNNSIQTAEEIKLKATQIEELFKKIEKLTTSIKILSTFDIDTTPLDLRLLYVKSDFESANIEISNQESESLDIEVSKIFFNISKQKYKDLETYKENLAINNINETFFEKFYTSSKKEYESKNYFEFLNIYKSFEDIKKIIEQKRDFEQNYQRILNQNISFNRVNGSLDLFEFQINELNYVEAKKTISELNNQSKLALFLRSEIKILDNDFNSAKELGIIDNKTEEYYNKTKSEYSLENFDEANSLLKDTKKRIQDIQSQNIVFGGIRKAQLQKGLKDFFINNWPYLLVLIIISIIIYNPVKRYIGKLLTNNKLVNLKLEREAIISLQKDLQTSYYVDHIIDKKSYHKDFIRFEEKKTDLGNKIALNEEKLRTYDLYFKKLKNKLLFKKWFIILRFIDYKFY